MNNIETSGQVCREISLSDIVTALSSAKNALILCHMNPDGDTVGSAFALRDLIRACGGEASVACHDEMPRRLAFLSGSEGFVQKPITADGYDFVLAVDVASPAQLGDYSELVPQIDFMLDHHETGEAFARNYIDPSASSAGEIVYAIYRELKLRGAIGALPDATRKIYAAVVSDTGNFKFSNTTEITHKIAAELHAEINSADDGGMKTADVCRSLFGQRTLSELRAQMTAIENLQFFEDGRLGVVVFTIGMLEERGLSETDIGNSVETPRGVEGVFVGISIRQLSADPMKYKISSRANVDIDVAEVCAGFGGGGHVRAAGCTVTAESPEKALAIAVDAFGDAIRNYLSKVGK